MKKSTIIKDQLSVIYMVFGWLLWDLEWLFLAPDVKVENKNVCSALHDDEICQRLHVLVF